jgi:hypothetical protein
MSSGMKHNLRVSVAVHTIFLVVGSSMLQSYACEQSAVGEILKGSNFFKFGIKFGITMYFHFELVPPPPSPPCFVCLLMKPEPL